MKNHKILWILKTKKTHRNLRTSSLNLKCFKVKSGYKKLTKSQMKSKKKTKTKAKRDLMKAKKTLKRALARYNKVMKM